MHGGFLKVDAAPHEPDALAAAHARCQCDTGADGTAEVAQTLKRRASEVVASCVLALFLLVHLLVDFGFLLVEREEQLAALLGREGLALGLVDARSVDLVAGVAQDEVVVHRLFEHALEQRVKFVQRRPRERALGLELRVSALNFDRRYLADLLLADVGLECLQARAVGFRGLLVRTARGLAGLRPHVEELGKRDAVGVERQAVLVSLADLVAYALGLCFGAADGALDAHARALAVGSRRYADAPAVRNGLALGVLRLLNASVSLKSFCHLNSPSFPATHV